ncbi:MAG TPA: hypothetical protein VFG23_09655 [Polyangia bacterium]|nr:hypothetical protein [Polyangia bacterium]
MKIMATTAASLSYPIAVVLAQAPHLPDQNREHCYDEIRIVSTGISADVFGSILVGSNGLQFQPLSDQATVWTDSSNPLDDVEGHAQALTNDRMRDEALAVASGLRDALADSEETPPTISASQLPDGSFIIEFVGPGKRAGFTIEPEEGQSGWFFASFDGSHPISASGSLGFLEPEVLLRRFADAPFPKAA